VCGCFRDTLEEFEKRVFCVHQYSHYLEGYMNWIKKVKEYLA
jgi:hypothetical protein